MVITIGLRAAPTEVTFAIYDSDAGATHLFQDASVPGFARPVVAIDDGQSGTGEAQLLFDGERIHMLNFAKVPEGDDRVTDRRRFNVRCFERLALNLTFADRE